METVPKKAIEIEPYIPDADIVPEETVDADIATPDVAPHASPNLELLQGGLENGEEPVDTQVPSRIAHGMNRVAGFLQDRAESLSERAADRTQRAIDRSERKALRYAARREMLDNAKASIFKIGRGALKAAKLTGLVTVGLGIMGAEAGAKGIQKGAEATASAASSAKEYAISKGSDILETARETKDTLSLAAILAADHARGEAARARKAARAAGHATKEKAKETADRVNTRRRILGANALSFFDRARAAGEAAKSTWESHSTQNKL